MRTIRLLPVVVVTISALLVLKTAGLVLDGGYVLAGVGTARAAGGGDVIPAGEAGLDVPAPEQGSADAALTPADILILGDVAAEGESVTGQAELLIDPILTAALSSEAPVLSSAYCVEPDATVTEEGRVMEGEGNVAGADTLPRADCLPSGDAEPLQIDGQGTVLPLIGLDAASSAEKQLLERLAERRTELQQYEQDLAMRASLVDAAEKRIEERTATLQALEAQIAALVDQREQMESGRFAGVVAMYEAMKPKDAAKIFDNLDMNVLLRVAQTMSPRKMAPIMAEMEPVRAQELTVLMAGLADKPVTEMTADNLAALPQIVGR